MRSSDRLTAAGAQAMSRGQRRKQAGGIAGDCLSIDELPGSLRGVVCGERETTLPVVARVTDCRARKQAGGSAGEWLSIDELPGGLRGVVYGERLRNAAGEALYAG